LSHRRPRRRFFDSSHARALGTVRRIPRRPVPTDPRILVSWSQDLEPSHFPPLISRIESALDAIGPRHHCCTRSCRHVLTARVNGGTVLMLGSVERPAECPCSPVSPAHGGFFIALGTTRRGRSAGCSDLRYRWVRGARSGAGIHHAAATANATRCIPLPTSDLTGPRQAGGYYRALRKCRYCSPRRRCRGRSRAHLGGWARQRSTPAALTSTNTLL